MSTLVLETKINGANGNARAYMNGHLNKPEDKHSTLSRYLSKSKNVFHCLANKLVPSDKTVGCHQISQKRRKAYRTTAVNAMYLTALRINIHPALSMRTGGWQ
ncbi:hypothetical protein NQ317_015751 [Molorchus minor]|uniref:Uncharacterized protein n=1 Tax=Molorchus minor TaxID=1323400 RepID=A0ABQ9K2X1_9CUCU|nr:hypothetical protein NQ317_015751 [Molorchus minor]